METLLAKASTIVSLLVVSLIVGLVCSIPVMLLWNWLVPPIFGFASVNLLQAFGLSVLTEMLFTSYSTPQQ